MRPFLLLIIIIISTALLSAPPAAAAMADLVDTVQTAEGEGLRRGARFFQPEPGFVRLKDLPESEAFTVDTVRFAVQDAFDGAAAFTKYERWVYGLGNHLHIESREGTIRRRLTFAAGDTVGRGHLLESEKALRDEQFLADAIIEVGPDRGGARTVKVTTYDQWTTALIVGAQLVKGDVFSHLFSGDWRKLFREEWLVTFGVMESNVLGTGTRLGAFYKTGLERDILEAQLNNQSFSRYNLQGSLYAAALSDGHSYQARLNRPLRSREDRHAFTAHASSLRLTEFLYFDANRLDALPEELARPARDDAHVAARFLDVTHDSLYLSYTRSYGGRLKVNVGPSFFRQERYWRGKRGRYDTVLVTAAPNRAGSDVPWLRDDALLGAHLTFHRYDYATARNFRNLKWNENVETGWRLTTRAAMNQEWLGASDADLWFAQEAAFGGAWRDAWFASCSLGTSAFLSSDGGDLEDGRVDASFEAQWKPVGFTSTYLSGAWSHLYATAPSRQLVLGASEGLSGFPSFYYSGQARALFLLEQRIFPEFEFATVVSAFSAFLAAGNTFRTYADFDPADLHYSPGMGLRLGRSKSPSKAIQHVNLSWPIAEEGLSGPILSVLAKVSL